MQGKQSREDVENSDEGTHGHTPDPHLVDRLRPLSRRTVLGRDDWQEAFKTAADEIERLRKDRDELRHSLAALLDYTDRHHVSYTEHDHDCFELWCVESEFAKQLLSGAS